jgi:hypothetical protein
MALGVDSCLFLADDTIFDNNIYILNFKPLNSQNYSSDKSIISRCEASEIMFLSDE